MIKSNLLIGYADKNDTIFYISNGIVKKKHGYKLLFLEILKKHCGIVL